ncbi:hypothetical protein B0A52_03291 [Exophiala mesophila]|uniref:Transketolase-like C-terminal domain-containing protein n=1 Tax=Exophiala mesophila TaxID=212818 RepID=A0A438NAY8_EXOME|nr:hypothetical protein B0A52_03291 [Exophiala mesophila]
MPNFLYIRPSDTEEVAGAFIAALEATDTPTVISLSRHGFVQYTEHSSRDGVQRGAYVFIEQEDAAVTPIGVGSEMMFAVQTRDVHGKKGVNARVDSFPCQRSFILQDKDYRESVMQYGRNIPTVVIEAYAVNGWESFADAGYGMGAFGRSLPGPDAYEFFNFNGQPIADKVHGLLKGVEKDGLQSLRGNLLGKG